MGGFYDSGNNIKFSFSTAYTITLLSWTVIEYHQKYADIGELDHIMDIIKWGSDYLLKTFVPKTSATSDTILYSQASPYKFKFLLLVSWNLVSRPKIVYKLCVCSVHIFYPQFWNIFGIISQSVIFRAQKVILYSQARPFKLKNFHFIFGKFEIAKIEDFFSFDENLSKIAKILCIDVHVAIMLYMRYV